MYDQYHSWRTFLTITGFPDSLVGKESACNAGDPSSIPVSGTSTGERGRLPTPVFLGFPCGSVGKESACNVGNLGSVSGLGRSPGEGKGYPLQCCSLENSVDCKSQTQLSDFQFHFTSHSPFPLKILSPRQSTTCLLSFSINLPLLDVSCKENHTAGGPLWLTSFY